MGQGKGVARGNAGLIIPIFEWLQVIGTAFTNLTAYYTQLCLQRTIWLPRLLSQYTKSYS